MAIWCDMKFLLPASREPINGSNAERRPWYSVASTQFSDDVSGDGIPLLEKRAGAHRRAWQTKSASAIPFAPGWHTPKAMTLDEIERLKESFYHQQPLPACLALGHPVVAVHALRANGHAPPGAISIRRE